MHDPIAYTFEADVHCEDCAYERFGRDQHGDITGEDAEGNEVGAIAPWDEWHEPALPLPQTLNCGTCREEIERIDYQTDELEDLAYRHGEAVGSWVIDGNTPDEVCRQLLQQSEDGDPAFYDQLPEPRLGQWAGDPTWPDILQESGIDPDHPDVQDADAELWDIYLTYWTDGMADAVVRDCEARVRDSVIEGGDKDA
jgi:hypothetical protein